MKKFRLLFMLMAAAVLSFTACQKSEGGSSAPEEPKEVGFFGDVNLGTGNMYQPGMNLTMAVGLPGHWVKIQCENVQATLFMLDFSGDPMQYAYLKEGFYPVVAGSFENMQWPTVSSLVATEPDYCNFYVFSENMIYTPVVPETEADADGNPYGITIVASPATTGMDMSYLEFNVPVVDQNGKPAVVKGYYCGPIGYENLGGGAGGAKQTLPLNINEWGLTTFEATYDEEYNTLALVSSNAVGTFRMNFNLRETEGKFLDQTFTALEGDAGNITGFFEDFEATRWSIDTGTVKVTATDTPGVYNLLVAERAPLFFWGDSSFYEMAGGEYTITINNLPEGL